MGSSECRVSHTQQYRQKKKQNHPILGEIILTQIVESGSYLTLKHVKMTTMQGYKKLHDINSSLSLEKHKEYQNKKKYLSIKQLIFNHSVLFLLPGFTNQQIGTVVLQCTEVNIQNIQYSKYFTKFQQSHLLNIMTCVLDGINFLQNHKIGVYPISKKSVIMASNFDEYKGEDLTQAIFKVIPLQIVQPETLKKNEFHQMLLGQLPENEDQQVKSLIEISYNPNTHIYCLGMLLLDIISTQERQAKKQNLDYSFGIKQFFQKTGGNRNKQQKIQILQGCSMSQTFIKIIKLMVEENQENRIGFTCLHDACKILKNRDNKQFRQYLNCVSESLDNCTKREYFSSRTTTKINRTKRVISSIGLAQKQIQINTLSKLVQKLQQKTANQLLDRKNVKQNRNSSIKNINKSQNLRKAFSLNNSIEKVKIKNEIESKKKADQLAKEITREDYKKIVFQSGAFYEGELDDHNNFNGFGTLYYSQKEICYTGYWKQNHFHGFGYLFNQQINTNKFIEEVKKNSFINYKDFSKIDGKLLMESLWEHYEGQFNFDEKDGYGRIYFLDGSRFQGQFMKNKMHGTGTFVMRNGKNVNGIWKNNKLFKEYE